MLRNNRIIADSNPVPIMNRNALSPCAGAAESETILADLQSRLGPRKYNAWFRHGTRVNVADGHTQVSVPNPFVANWIEKHYSPQIAAAVAAATGKDLPVVVTIDPELSGQLRKKQLDVQADIVTRTRAGAGQSTSSEGIGAPGRDGPA